MSETHGQPTVVRVALPPQLAAPYRRYEFDTRLHTRVPEYFVYYHIEAPGERPAYQTKLLDSLPQYLLADGSGVDSVRVSAQVLIAHCQPSVPVTATNDLVIRAIRNAGYEPQNMKRRTLYTSAERAAVVQREATPVLSSPATGQGLLTPASEPLLETFSPQPGLALDATGDVSTG